MKVILANPRGFCAGVNRAIEIVEKVIQLHGVPIYVRHELVHNDYVIDQLSQKGVIFIEKIEEVPNGAILIFSAHGVSQKIWEETRSRDLTVFDATCPLVKKVHMEVIRASRKGMEVILIGHSGHPEVEGTMGQYVFNVSIGAIYLVESKLDALSVQVRDPGNLFVVTQTTLSVDETSEIISILRRRFPSILLPRKNDICYATINRQDALKQLSSMVELIFIIGSNASSNSKRLLELARQLGKVAYLINDVNDIKEDWLYNIHNIGITAGASAPETLVCQVLKRLDKLSMEKIFVEEMSGKKENIFFNISKDLLKK